MAFEAFEAFQTFGDTWILSLTWFNGGKHMFSMKVRIFTVTLGYVVIPTHDLIVDKTWGKVDVLCFFTISKLWNHELIQPADLSTKKLSRATDRNWKCSLRRRKCLTASFSHWRPSDKMVGTSFLFLERFWLVERCWIQPLGLVSKFTISTGRFSSGVQRKTRREYPSYGTGPSILGRKLPASYRQGNLHTWSFQDFSSRSESWIDSWQETTKYQGVEWAA